MISVLKYISADQFTTFEGLHCIAWIKCGKGSFTVNSTTFFLRDCSILSLSREQQVTFSEDAMLEACAVWFEDSDYPKSSIESMCRIVLLYNHFKIHNQILIPEAFSKDFEQLFQLMYLEGNGGSSQRSNPVLSLLLQTLLIKMEQVIRKTLPVAGGKDSQEEEVVMAFLELLENNFTSKHKVKDYADLMALPSRKLNDIIRDNFGMTAKDVISNKLYVEVARRLQFTSDTVKEIAFSSGFNTPYHLSHFFTKMKGISPQAYREKMKK